MRRSGRWLLVLATFLGSVLSLAHTESARAQEPMVEAQNRALTALDVARIRSVGEVAFLRGE